MDRTCVLKSDSPFSRRLFENDAILFEARHFFGETISGEGKALHRRESIFAFILVAVFFVECNISPASSTIAISSPTWAGTPSPTETSTPIIEPAVTIPVGTLMAVSTMDALVTAKPELGEYYSHECMLYSSCLAPQYGLSPNGQSTDKSTRSI